MYIIYNLLAIVICKYCTGLYINALQQLTLKIAHSESPISFNLLKYISCTFTYGMNQFYIQIPTLNRLSIHCSNMQSLQDKLCSLSRKCNISMGNMRIITSKAKQFNGVQD